MPFAASDRTALFLIFIHSHKGARQPNLSREVEKVLTTHPRFVHLLKKVGLEKRTGFRAADRLFDHRKPAGPDKDLAEFQPCRCVELQQGGGGAA
jgi:hypothetical protein